MKILIVGANGMLGHALSETFKNERPILCDKDDLDITKKSDVFNKISVLKPEVLINAAAYTDVDGAEREEGLATNVNGYAVGYLGQACANFGIKFVHYSTDYVFSGDNPGGYKEHDEPGRAVNTYGESKLLGENILTQIKGLKYFLIRSSWLYGRHGKNFVDTILELAKTKKEIKVVNDQHGKPTYFRDLAQQSKFVLERMPPSIYHITNTTLDEGITWYDFARKIIEIKKLDVKIIPCSPDEFLRPAKRPQYSMLVNTKLEPLRGWEEALKEFLS